MMAIKLEKRIYMKKLSDLPHADLAKVREQMFTKACFNASCHGKMRATNLRIEAQNRALWYCDTCGEVRFL